jgi:hypothetical protein
MLNFSDYMEGVIMRKAHLRKFSALFVGFILVFLAVSCSMSPAPEDEDTSAKDAEAAETFKETHSAILALDLSDIGTSHKGAVNAALAAYTSCSSGAKNLLKDEKAKLDEFKNKITVLEAGSAGIKFTFTTPQDGDISVEQLGSLDWNNTTELTVTVTGGGTVFQWILDGDPNSPKLVIDEGNPNRVIIKAENFRVNGDHYLAAKVKIDGVTHSIELKFSIAFGTL